MNNNSLPYWLTLAVALVGGYCGWKYWQVRNHQTSVHSAQLPDDASTAVATPTRARLTEFSLDDRSGKTLHSRDMKGKVWVTSFFYTTCPGSCVRLNQALQTLQLDAALQDVRFVSITCDPDTDTLEVLSDYADRFDADKERWFFCRGDWNYVQQINADMLELPLERQTHSDRAVVFDREGKIRGRFVATDPNQLASLRNLLYKCVRESPADNVAAEDDEEQGTDAAPADPDRVGTSNHAK